MYSVSGIVEKMFWKKDTISLLVRHQVLQYVTNMMQHSQTDAS